MYITKLAESVEYCNGGLRVAIDHPRAPREAVGRAEVALHDRPGCARSSSYIGTCR